MAPSLLGKKPVRNSSSSDSSSQKPAKKPLLHFKPKAPVERTFKQPEKAAGSTSRPRSTSVRPDNTSTAHTFKLPDVPAKRKHTSDTSTPSCPSLFHSQGSAHNTASPEPGNLSSSSESRSSSPLLHRAKASSTTNSMSIATFHTQHYTLPKGSAPSSSDLDGHVSKRARLDAVAKIDNTVKSLQF